MGAVADVISGKAFHVCGGCPYVSREPPVSICLRLDNLVYRPPNQRQESTQAVPHLFPAIVHHPIALYFRDASDIL